jgi:hypothetical protein
LVELGKKLRKRTAGSQALTENEVEVALRKEFEELLKGGQLDDIINPLLGTDGEFFLATIRLLLSLKFLQGWIFIWILLLKSFIQYSWASSSIFGGRQCFFSRK